MKSYKKISFSILAAIILMISLTGCGSESYYSNSYYVTPYQEVISAGEYMYSVKYVYAYNDIETDVVARLRDGTIATYTVRGDMAITATYETLSIIYNHLSDGTVAGPYLVTDHDTTYYWGYLLLDTKYF